jgi:hypothetical protein
MSPVRPWQASDEVHTNFFPFPRGHLQWLQQTRMSLVLGLDTLADVTSGNIKCYLSLHTVPPKLLFQVLVHFGTPWVNRVGCIMGLFQDKLFQLIDARDA